MKTKYAILNGDLYTVEVIVMGSGRMNIKVVEPENIYIPSEEFDKKTIFNTRVEARQYLEKNG